MYTVHMKHVTATAARKDWFRLLDEAAAGEVIVIKREGTRLVLERQDSSRRPADLGPPSYEGLIRADGMDEADRWTWDWPGSDEPNP